MEQMGGRTIAEQHVPASSPNPPAPDVAAQAAAQVAAIADQVTSSIGRVLAGHDDSIRMAITCLLSGGHLLIEDIPGVGKTLLAQALAASVGGSFHRIQGTSDLLPGDVTGTMMPYGDGFDLRFRPGPIFSNVVVFDELNRANPRTQSALLEATEEGAVTVDGETRPLPSPFMLVATQNPVEMAGTYPLTEGALDRFAAVVTPGRAAPEDEVAVLTGRRGRSVLKSIMPVVPIADLVMARAHVADVFVAERLAQYVVAILDATRQHPKVRLGASTRGGVALMGLAKANAAIAGRHYVVPYDVVQVANAALAHRVIVVDADGSISAGREVVAECVGRVPAPTA
jgi:MoxR-like ATPase